MASYDENNTPQNITPGDNTTTKNNQISNSFPTGSNTSFPLSKTIISNQKAKTQSTVFKEIIISEEKYDNKKILEIYNDLFYQIPKKGKKSHTSIIEQSTDYVYPEQNQNLEDNIKILEEQIEELNEKYLFETLPKTNSQHPLWDNGLILQEGDTINNSPVEPGSTMWYMQQGLKRKINNSSRGYYVRLLRQSNGEIVHKNDGSYIAPSESPNFRYLTPEELNDIKDGEDIDGATSLNIDPLKEINPQYLYSEIELELTCLGVEKFYKFKAREEGYDYDLSGYPETGGYWWVDTEGSCKLRYETDIDPSTTFKRKINNITFNKKTVKNITISRDSRYYNYSLNGTNNPLETEFYNNIAETYIHNDERNLFPTMKIWKKWGDKVLFPSITKVEKGSRIAYKMKSPYDSNGTIVEGTRGSSHLLHGIIDGNEANAKDQVGILNSYYRQNSTFGTRMINNACYGPLGDNCYGALGQNSSLKNLFSDPSNDYYDKNANNRENGTFTNTLLGITINSHKVKGRVYGQPIIEVDGDYCVFLESYRVRYISNIHYDYNVFIKLSDGNIFRIKNKDLEGRVTGYKRNSDDLFNWLPKYKDEAVRAELNEVKNYINNPTIYFPGLKGYSINYENTDLDGDPTTGYFSNIWVEVKGFVNDILNRINNGAPLLPGGFNFKFVEGQIKDNPFNPKNGGSNYEWHLKEITK